MAQEFSGMLNEFGLPANSPEEEMARRGQVIYRDLTKRIRPTDTSMAATGARIGSMINANRNSKLDADEQKKYEAVASATERMKIFQEQNPDKWQRMPPERRALLFNQYLSDSAFSKGLPEIGAVAAERAAAAAKTRREKDQRLKLLGIQVNQADENLDQTIIDNENKNAHGESTTFYPTGTNDPNTGRTGRMLPDGRIRYTGEDGKVKFAKPGEYTVDRPNRPPLGGSGGGGRTLITNKDAGALRVAGVNVMRQMRTANAMHDTMATFAQQYGSVDFLDKSGALTDFTKSLMNNITSITRSFGLADTLSLVDNDGKVTGSLNATTDAGIARFLGKNKDLESELLAEYNVNAERFRESGISFAEWSANVVRLAYSRARAREPGARQLSDTDVKNAMREIGANTTDPEAFRRIMRSGLGQDLASFNDSRMALPEDVRNNVFGAGWQEDFDALVTEFDSRFSQPFGTASNPGAGLLDVGGTPRTPEQQSAIDAEVDQILQSLPPNL